MAATAAPAAASSKSAAGSPGEVSLGNARRSSAKAPAGNTTHPAAMATSIRLTQALRHARAQNDIQIVASFWLGLGAFGFALLSILAKSGALYLIGVVAGVAAIVTANFARQRARTIPDADLIYLSRYGQVLGWIVVGLLIAGLVLWAIFLGSLVAAFGH